eukprot:GDKI01044153.1.p1 GENE.GDKI01044153.1~~GDKI01044153.1.p1  ORF type:complete len:315 (-),score=45.41 GDKI01044153.1:552-1496(-)
MERVLQVPRSEEVRAACLHRGRDGAAVPHRMQPQTERVPDEETARLLYKKWGGCAHSVLTYGHDHTEQQQLATAVEPLDMKLVEVAMKTTSALDGVGGKDQAHRLLNLVPCGSVKQLETTSSKYYENHHAELISEHVMGLFGDRLAQDELNQVYRFLHKAASDPTAATLRGKLYEHCVVVPRLLSGPDGLKLARLSPGTPPGWLKAGQLSCNNRLKHVRFSELSELKSKRAESSEEDAIFQPNSPVFTAVDFVVRINGQALLANATVGASHDIKLGDSGHWDGLLNAVNLADTQTDRSCGFLTHTCLVNSQRER